MRATVNEIALEFATAAPGSRCIVDLGCSRGEAIAALVAGLDSDTRFVGVETSAPMLAAARERFADDSNVSLLDLDLRLAYPEVRANVTLGVLTLQFVPIEHRQRLIQQVYEHTEPGGAFISRREGARRDRRARPPDGRLLPHDETSRRLHAGGDRPQAAVVGRRARAGGGEVERRDVASRRLPAGRLLLALDELWWLDRRAAVRPRGRGSHAARWSHSRSAAVSVDR